MLRSIEFPSWLCASQAHELSAHSENTTHRKWEASSLEFIRKKSASEQPRQMCCTQAYQSSLHCTPSTHIDRLNGAKLLQETSHILLSCPFVELSYPECGTANYNQELAQMGQSLADTSSSQDREPTLIPCWIQDRKRAQCIPRSADYCSNTEYSSRFSTRETQNCKLWQPTWQTLGKVLAAAHLTALPGSFHWTATRALHAFKPLGLSLVALKTPQVLSLLCKKEWFYFTWYSGVGEDSTFPRNIQKTITMFGL